MPLLSLSLKLEPSGLLSLERRETSRACLAGIGRRENRTDEREHQAEPLVAVRSAIRRSGVDKEQQWRGACGERRLVDDRGGDHPPSAKRQARGADATVATRPAQS